MADLSDLDTAQIGIIAFWNALDHRVVPGIGDVDPTDCIAIFDSYDVYDNGIEGYKALGSGRYFHARVKTDGWMVAWIDRTNTFAYPTKEASEFGEDARKGYYDILKGWRSSTGNIDAEYTELSGLIRDFYNSLSNSGDFNFSAANVGHYCYEHTLASVLTLMDAQVDHATKNSYLQYTTGTALYYAAVTGVGYNSHGSVLYDFKVIFAGNVLIDDNEQIYKYAAADILTEGWMPLPLTDYTLYTYGDLSGKAHGSIILIWS